MESKKMYRQHTEAFHIILEPYSLQDMALYTIYSHRHDINTKDLDILPHKLYKTFV